MTGFRKWTAALGVGLAVVAIMAVAFPAAAATTTPDVAAHRGGGNGVSNTALAEALGITTTELATAQENAQKAAIEQAVEEGLITQAQADALLARGGTYGFRGHGGFFGSDTIDYDALLAEELNITVEKLQEARTTAYDATLAQAVEDGRITQEQADLLKAQQALNDYMTEKGVPAALQKVYEDAVNQAVADGVITQAQADAILAQSSGFKMFRMPGFGGRGGHGGMRFFGTPNSDSDSTTNSRFSGGFGTYYPGL
jgi:hypothetical protein